MSVCVLVWVPTVKGVLCRLHNITFCCTSIVSGSTFLRGDRLIYITGYQRTTAYPIRGALIRNDWSEVLFGHSSNSWLSRETAGATIRHVVRHVYGNTEHVAAAPHILPLRPSGTLLHRSSNAAADEDNDYEV